MSIPLPGNRHFYPTLAGCPARAAFRGRNLLRLYFFVFSLESNRLFCENLKHFFEVINNTSVYSSDYFTTSEQNCNRMLRGKFSSVQISLFISRFCTRDPPRRSLGAIPVEISPAPTRDGSPLRSGRRRTDVHWTSCAPNNPLSSRVWLSDTTCTARSG